MATSAPNPLQQLVNRIRGQGDVFLAVALGAFLVIMIVPMPATILDLLLTVSISTSLLILLTTFYVKAPVQFSIFPTLLLATTLYRLSLNVASTRLILLSGGSESSAGKIIETFGQVVVGGSYVVGLVVFIILVVINFVVITKGAGRVAEVAARFTLDAMPGKQMAIDAELNAGLINEVEARKRREEITREADFYGAMDGASKFIRGDAIAGIVITLVNILGGIIIGVFQEGLGFGDAAQIYTVLTIGDGLVSQIPALIISAAAGMLVTRVVDDDKKGLAGQFGKQLFTSHRALALLSAALVLTGVGIQVYLPFFVMAALAGTASLQAYRRYQAELNRPKGPDLAQDSRASDHEAPVETLLRVEPLAVELGVDLINLVDERKGGNLVERIQRIRRQIASDVGMLVPPVHLRDNLRMEGGEYRVLLRGEEVARGKLLPRQLLAINPGDATQGLRGIPWKDPVFGLESLWISEDSRLHAQTMGYTVVDCPTVVTTHLTECIQQYGHELFGRQQLADILERVQQQNPRLVEDIIPEPLSRSTVLNVFRNLLRESISIRDAQTILEALADHAHRVQDADVLTEFVRQRLARHITHRYAKEGVVHYIGLAPDAEQAISNALHGGEGGSMNLTLDPSAARKLLTGIRSAAESWRGAEDVVVLCPPLARGPLRRLTEKVVPRVPVVSPAELMPTVRLERVAAVSLRNAS